MASGSPPEADNPFERPEVAAAWRRSAAQRVEALGEVTERMLEAARIGPGSRVLEVGTGTGDVALKAAGRVSPGGSVLAIDVSPAMIELAAEAARQQGLRNLELRVMDGGQLEVESGSFDAVVGRHSIQFIPDTAAALRGFHRALRPGGRLAAVVWAGRAENPYQWTAVEIAERHGWLRVPEASLARPFRLADADHLLEMLAGAGFTEASVERVPVERRLPSVEQALAQLRDNPMFQAVARELSGTERETFEAELAARFEGFREGSRLVVRGAVLLATASG